MEQDVSYYAAKRHSAKAFDPERKISEAQLAKLKTLLRCSPSSTNSQPWHFVIASSDEAKAKVAKAAEHHKNNIRPILDASHVIVFCRKTDMDEAFVEKITEQEFADGRFGDDLEKKAKMHEKRLGYTRARSENGTLNEWMSNQVYLNLGMFLLGVATLGIDALPIEGIDADVVDAQFDLKAQGFTSLALVAVGYSHKENDYNAPVPKSRLAYDEIITEV